jgi:hypothetical protein
MKKKKLLLENESLKARLEECVKDKRRIKDEYKKEKIDRAIFDLSYLGHLQVNEEFKEDSGVFIHTMTIKLTM